MAEWRQSELLGGQGYLKRCSGTVVLSTCMRWWAEKAIIVQKLEDEVR